MTAARVFCFIVAVACGMLGAACRRAPSVVNDVRVEWKITPSPPIAGGATLAELMLRDSARRPVRGARLRVEGHMSHPGMAPVMATAAERDDGVYEVRLPLTMRGAWILVVTGELPDGRRINHRIDVTSTGPPPG